MPEVILPCPACGAVENEGDKFALSYRLGVQIICHKCGMYGPVADDFHEAVKRWNTLPRALTWTHEPPKVAGWYWRKETAAGRAHVFHFTGNWEDYGEHWESDRVCQLPLILNDNLWAGPIDAPHEPEES